MLGDRLRILGLSGRKVDFPLASGDSGVLTTIQAMTHLTQTIQSNPLLVRALSDIKQLAGTGQYGTTRDVFAIAAFYWLRSKITFCSDPQRIELLRDPLILLNDIYTRGSACVDCDEMAILGVAILRAVGFQTVFITISQRQDLRFQHVYFGFYQTEPSKRGILLPLDPQETDAPGKEVMYTRKRVYPVN